MDTINGTPPVSFDPNALIPISVATVKSEHQVTLTSNARTFLGAETGDEIQFLQHPDQDDILFIRMGRTKALIENNGNGNGNTKGE